MDFVVIDFETAAPERHNPCEIGITVVVKSAIAKTISYLIKPPCFPNFSPHNIKIHGIKPKDVANALTFDVLWNDIKYYFRDSLVVAHNVNFDKSVLEKTLSHYGIATPAECNWLCSLEFARYHYPDAASHKLEDLCTERGIEYNAHRAGTDSEATAKVLLQMLREQKIDDLSALVQYFQFIKPQVIMPKESEGRFISFSKRLHKVKTDSSVAVIILDLLDELGIKDFETLKLLAESTQKQSAAYEQWMKKWNQMDDKPLLVYSGAEPNPESPVFEKTVVFTRFSANRECELADIVYRIGGTVGQNITKRTAFLVIADENANDILFPEKRTSKMKKALEYVEKYNLPLQIIPESEFINLLGCEIDDTPF